MGRQLLGGYPVFDLTGGFKSFCPPAGMRDAARDRDERNNGKRRGHCRTGFPAEEAIKSMIPVVLDWQHGKPIRDALKGNRNVLFLGRPNPDQDLLLFFHDQFLLSSGKALPC